MADRYWRGGTGTWDTTNTANWSATNGGAGGASVPTAADDVYFTSSSGSGTCTVGASVVCQNLYFNAFGGSSVTFAGTGAVTISFACRFSTTGGYTHTGNLSFTGGGNAAIAGNGRTVTSSITLNKTGATMTLETALTMTNTFNSNFSNTTGTRALNLNGFVLTCRAFVWGNNSASINFGATGKVVISASTAGNVLITTARGYPTDSRIEVLSPPAGVTVTLIGDTSATAIDYYPNIYLIASGTGSINSQSCAGAIFDVGAGNFGVVGAGQARRTYNISASYTGTHSGSASLGAIDATGVTANFNGKTVGGLGVTAVPVAVFAGGSYPITINSSVTATGQFTWNGTTVTLGTNVVVTANNFEQAIYPGDNNSRFIFGTGSKIRLTATSGAIFNTGSTGTNYYTRVSSLGIGNNTPIEIPSPSSGNTLTIYMPPGRDTTNIKSFGFKLYSVGSGGTIQIGHTFTGSDSNLSVGSFELIDTTLTLNKISFSSGTIYLHGNWDGGGANITNNWSGVVFKNTVEQFARGGGLNGGFPMSWYLDNTTGVTLNGDAIAGQIYFGDPVVGGGAGLLNLQSYTLRLGEGLFTMGQSNGININFGTGKISIRNERNNYASLGNVSDPNWIGTISGSRLLEISPWGTLADNWPKDFQWPANDSAKFLNLKVVANGSTGRIAVGSGQPLGANLTLGAGSYTFSSNAFSSTQDLALYGNLSVEGSSIIYSLGTLYFDLTSVTSTIFSNGNTIGGTLQTSTGKTVNLGDAVICNRFNLYGGTLNLGSFNFTVTSFYSDSSLVRTLNFGTGSITIAQNGLWNTPNTTNYTLAGTSRQLFPVVGSSAPSLTFSAASESFALDITPVIVGSGGTLALGSFARNLTIPAGTYTLNRDATYTLYGDLTVNGAITNYTGGGTALNFSKSSGTQLINTNGNVFGGTGNINLTTGAVKQLAGNSYFAATVLLTSGTLNLNNFRLEATFFTSSNTNVRTLDFGVSGAIRLTGTGTVFTTATSTNLTVSGTNRFIEPNLNGAQTLNFGALTEANTFDVSVPSTRATNTTLSFTAADNVRNLTFANVAYTVANVNINIYGSLNILGTTPTFTSGSNTWSFLSTTGSHTITTNGKALGFPIVKTGASTLTLNDNLTVTSNSFTMNSGTLDLSTRELSVGTFNTTNSNVRAITFGTGSKIIVNTTGTSFTAQDSTNLTVTGTNRTVEVRTTGGTGQVSGGLTASTSALFDLVVSSSATGTVQALRYWRNVTLQNGSYSYSAPTADSRVYGNFALLGTTPTLVSGAVALTFAATSGTNTIQTSGKTIPFPLNFNGVGGTWQLSDALTVSAGLINILTNGTFNANNFSVTMGSFESNNSNVRTLQMGNATWTLSDSSTFWNITTSTNMTLTRGTGASAAIVTTGTAAKTFQGGGLIYPRLTHSSNSVLTIAGTNTRFADITRGIAAATTFTFTSGQTFLFDDWNLSGLNSGARTVVNSTSGTQHTLSKSSGTISSDFLSITSSNATGGAAWYAGTGSLNNSNNTGWIFTAPPQASGNMLMVFM